MRWLVLACGLAAVLLSPVTAQDARAPQEQQAWFQAGNITRSGLRDTHTIALTFDDGPNAHTAEVLDVLKALNVKATFFVVGNMARRHPELLRRIVAEGHLLANHSANHARLGASYERHPERLLDEIRDVDDLIRPVMRSSDRKYFRAPYGAWKESHAGVLNADPQLRDYVGPIYWDVGGSSAMSRDGYVMASADWHCWRIGRTAQNCAKGYLREIRRKNGGVVLMHSIAPQSAGLVKAVVPALIEEGYTLVRLDQVPEYRQYETPQGAQGLAARLPQLPLTLARMEGERTEEK